MNTWKWKGWNYQADADDTNKKLERKNERTEWLIGWLIETCLDGILPSKWKTAQERQSSHQYGILLNFFFPKQTGPSAHISAQIWFSVTSRLRHRILFFAPSNDYSSMLIQRDVCAFKRQQMGCDAIKTDRNKNNNASITHPHSRCMASFRQFFTIIYFYLFFARLFLFASIFFLA